MNAATENGRNRRTFNTPTFSPRPDEIVDRLVRGVGAGPHDNDDPLRIGMPHVLEEAITSARQRGETASSTARTIVWAARVEEVRGFARLEKRVRVLRRPSEHRMVRASGARRRCAATRSSGISVLRSSSVSFSIFDTSCDVRKPSKKWINGTRARSVAACAMAAKSWASCDARGAEQRKPRGAACHDVRMVPEDRQRVRRHGARGDVHREGRQLARDLEHVGNHQKQPLRRGEGRRQGTGLQRAVNGPRGPGFRLHLDNIGNVAPKIAAALASTTHR